MVESGIWVLVVSISLNTSCFPPRRIYLVAHCISARRKPLLWRFFSSFLLNHFLSCSRDLKPNRWEFFSIEFSGLFVFCILSAEGPGVFLDSPWSFVCHLESYVA